MATILIVDDEPANRLLVKTVLDHAGHQTFEAANASDAQRFLRERVPDLTLIDLSLPGMSGTELVHVLREDPAGKNLRIAIYTGSDITAPMRDFMAVHGITDVIPKPCEPPALISAVESALSR
jgi:CheY-like chemotaxis protein